MKNEEKYLIFTVTKMATFKTKTVHSGSGCYGGKNTAFALFTRVHKGGKLMVWPLFKKIELWKTSFLEALN